MSAFSAEQAHLFFGTLGLSKDVVSKLIENKVCAELFGKLSEADVEKIFPRLVDQLAVKDSIKQLQGRADGISFWCTLQPFHGNRCVGLISGNVTVAEALRQMLSPKEIVHRITAKDESTGLHNLTTAMVKDVCGDAKKLILECSDFSPSTWATVEFVSIPY